MKKLLTFFWIMVPMALFSQGNETYDVYTSLIIKNFGRDAGLITLRNTTSAGINTTKPEYDYLKQSLKGLKQETFDDFMTKNEKPDTLRNNFGHGLKVRLLTSEEVTAIFHNGGWDAFYKKYGHTQGLLRLSAVGFDNMKNQALLYFGNQSNWLAGAGYYVLLEKKNGKWVIVRSIMAWIS